MAEAIYAAVRRLSGEGSITVLLVEQNASLALDASRNAFSWRMAGSCSMAPRTN